MRDVVGDWGIVEEVEVVRAVEVGGLWDAGVVLLALLAAMLAAEVLLVALLAMDRAPTVAVERGVEEEAAPVLDVLAL